MFLINESKTLRIEGFPLRSSIPIQRLNNLNSIFLPARIQLKKLKGTELQIQDQLFRSKTSLFTHKQEFFGFCINTVRFSTATVFI